MTYSASKVITEAKNWIGYLEKASMGTDTQMQSKGWNPGSNNITWFWTYLKRNGCLNLQGGAWCDGFVDFCHVMAAGVEPARQGIGGFSGYTPDSAQRYQAIGGWIGAAGTPKAGDQIFFRNSERIYHTGIVTGVSNATVYTIEGNTSANPGVVSNGGCVKEKSYSRDYGRIAGYGRPQYHSNEDTEIPVREWLQEGDYGESVRALQKNLIRLGYSCGNAGADASFGAATKGAVQRFQKDQNLAVDGQAGKNTKAKIAQLLAKLELPAGQDTWTKILQHELNLQFGRGLAEDGIPGPKTLSACITVKPGARGNITKLIQQKVGTNADGIWGSNTTKAVTAYQQRHGLSTDGVVGVNTWRAMLGL